MQIENNEEIKIKEIKALIEIVDKNINYKKFLDDIELLINQDKDLFKDGILSEKIDNSLQRKNVLLQKNYKKFVKKYSEVLDILQKNNCLENFKSKKYLKELENKRLSLESIYFYIENNKKDINKIKENIKKIEELNIENIIFNEDKDYTKKTYEYEDPTDIIFGKQFNFLENMQIESQNEKGVIQYKTTGSNYLLKIFITLEKYNKHSLRAIAAKPKTIEVNSLIFNKEKLPENITIDETINKLLEKDENLNLKHSLSKDEVYQEFFFKQLHSTLDSMKSSLGKMTNIKEKKIYLKRLTAIYNELLSYSNDFEEELKNEKLKVKK